MNHREQSSVVLVIDDEPSICWGFESLLTEQGYRVLTAGSAERGIEIAETHDVSMVIIDVRLPGMDGITAMSTLRQVTGDAPIIVMTAFGDLNTAVEAVRKGASEYLTKPFKLDKAIETCQRVLSLTGPSNGDSREPTQTATPGRGGKLVGKSGAMQQAFRQIAFVAPSTLSVLVTGQTGTGKELVAAAIHQHSDRSEQTYIPIAPVALNEQLVESELFGHCKGAFTGAHEDHVGLFEKAEGGTIFLDEIGDLSQSVQVKLLRVLEYGQFSRVGETTLRHTDVRILAATNCDLHRAVATGRFREDLFYRLAGVHIHLPPLQNRPDDIPLLCNHFLNEMNYANPTLSESLVEDLLARPWHGNVRELRNAVHHAAVVARGRALGISDFPESLAHRDAPDDQGHQAIEAIIARWCKDTVSHWREGQQGISEQFQSVAEPILIRIALEATEGNRVKAADLLGIHRGTLRERIRQYRIE